MCHRPWVRDFLFSRDAVHLSVMTSPLQAAQSMTPYFSESFVGRDSSSTGTVIAEVTGVAVMVPAFSADGVSLGVGVKQRTSATPVSMTGGVHSFLGSIVCDHIRYAMDEEEGATLTTRRNHVEGVVYVEIFKLVSPTQRKRIVLVFQEKEFLQVIYREGVHDQPKRLHDALAMIQVINEYRECQACGIALRPSCCCSFELQKSRHPMDFEAVKKNLFSQFGPFQGIETLNMYTRGTQVASAELGCRISVGLNVDKKLAHSLMKWALCDSVVHSTPNAMRHIMPLTFGSTDEAEADMYGYIGDLDDVEGEDVVVRKVERYAREGEAIEFYNNASKRAGLSLENYLHDYIQEKSKQFPNKVITEGSVVADMDDSLELRDRRSLDGAQRSSRHTGSSTGIETANGAGCATSDAGGNSADRESIAGVSKEKLSKMMQRKEKNREAARRSNMNKKVKNDQLRHDLKTTRAAMIALQEREAALRMENSTLRKMVTET